MIDFTIDLAEEFSRRPFGRYRDDGEYSAEIFLEEHLVPAIRNHDHVTLILSGTNYYGSSFLEETFGGLVRNGFTAEELHEKLKILHDKLPSVEAEAWEYVDKAQKAHLTDK